MEALAQLNSIKFSEHCFEIVILMPLSGSSNVRLGRVGTIQQDAKKITVKVLVNVDDQVVQRIAEPVRYRHQRKVCENLHIGYTLCYDESLSNQPRVAIFLIVQALVSNLGRHCSTHYLPMLP